MTSPDGQGLSNDDNTVGGWAEVGTALGNLAKFGEQLVLWPFSQFLGFVLNDDPANFDTLEELFDNLIPAIIKRVLGNLTGAITGTGGSDLDQETADEIIANIPIISDVVKVVQGVATGLTGLLAEAAEAVGLRWTTVDTTLADHNERLMKLNEGLQASDITSAWVSLDVDDMVSFPRVLLGLGLADTTGTQASHSHDVTGSTASGGTSTAAAHTHGAGTLGTSSSGSHSHAQKNALPTIQPGKGSLGLVPIPVNRGNSRPRKLKLITGDGSFWSTIFAIDNWYVGLYVLDTKGSANSAVWTVDKIWDGGDQKSAITTAAKEHAFDMGTNIGKLSPGQILFGAQLQNAGSLVSTRAIASLPQPGIAQAGTTLLPGSFFRLSGQSTLPVSIDFSSLTVDNTTIPWMAVTTEAVS